MVICQIQGSLAGYKFCKINHPILGLFAGYKAYFMDTNFVQQITLVSKK